MKRVLSFLAAAALLLAGCRAEAPAASDSADSDLISVGICQVGGGIRLAGGQFRIHEGHLHRGKRLPALF